LTIDDTSGYSLMGSGLFTGEDYPSTLKRLPTIYSTTGQCKPTGAALIGTLDEKNLHRYIDSTKKAKDPGPLIQQFTEVFPVATIHLGTEPFSVQGYDVGLEQDSTLRVRFENMTLNEGVKLSNFTYQKPDGLAVTDITDQIRNQ
jgi:hypothetical protein